MKFSRVFWSCFVPFGLAGMALFVGCKKMEPGEVVKGEGATAAKAEVPKMDFSGGMTEEEKNTAVAKVNGEVITNGQLMDEVGGNLIKLRTDIANKEYQLKKRALDELIDNKLLENEAKAKNMTVEALVKAEVDDKVPSPSDEELQAFFEQNKRRFPPNTEFAEHKDELAQVMKGRKAQEVRGEYLKGLREKAGVEVTLPFPELPAVPVSPDDDPSKGAKGAPVTIIEWSDYQCPYCKKNYEVMKQLEQKYGDKVTIVFRDFPLPFHDKAQKAAEASECADDQGKFWEIHDFMFTNQDKLDVDSLKSAASTLGMDGAKFNECLDSGKYKSEIEKDTADGKVAGVTGTPAAFINGRMVNGAQPIENFISLIDAELAKANKK
jgi:protein-disulfide isomerase